MHPDVQAVIETFANNRRRFEAFCLSLTDQELMRDVPNSAWVVKDFISHLATIDEPVTRYFHSIRVARVPSWDPPEGEPFHIHRFNHAMADERRDRSIEEILAEAEAKRAALLDELSQMGQGDLDLVINLGRRGSADTRFGDYLQGLARHDPMHTVDMMRALPERSTPELEAWFSDPVVSSYRKQVNV